MSERTKRRRQSNGMISISLIVLVFLVVMGVQIVKLKEQEKNYAKQESQLKEQLAGETQRAEELSVLEKYMQTTSYIEDVAKNKLGLVYENEIIYKEKK